MKKLLFALSIGIGMFFLVSMISKNDNPSSIIEIVKNKSNKEQRLKIYYIRHVEAGHNVKREWGIYPKNEWPAYVGNHEAFLLKVLCNNLECLIS